MDCRNFSQDINDFVDGRLDGLRDAACRVHVRDCPACRHAVDAEAQLRRQLRELPVTPPSAEYYTKVFDGIRAAPVAQPAFRPAFAAYALAASITMGIGLAMWLRGPMEQAPDRTASAESTSVVTVAQGETQPVKLMFRSPRDLPGVTIQLELPQGVELAGYPGRRELTWQTDLQSGANLLELPVIVQHGSGGVLTARLEHGADRKEFVVEVKTRRPAAGVERSMQTAAVSGARRADRHA